MLDRAVQSLAREEPHVADRVQLVEASGEEALQVVGGGFGCVLCHGVLMYLDDPEPLVNSLCRLIAPGGILSIVAKNVEVMALRHAHEGNWAAAIAAFDSDRQINGLGAETRGDHVSHIEELLSVRGVRVEEWCGVRLFTDGWNQERPPTDDMDLVLQAELLASRRDPYRRLSRLFHVIGRSSPP